MNRRVGRVLDPTGAIAQRCEAEASDGKRICAVAQRVDAAGFEATLERDLIARELPTRALDRLRLTILLVADGERALV